MSSTDASPEEKRSRASAWAVGLVLKTGEGPASTCTSSRGSEASICQRSDFGWQPTPGTSYWWRT
jgi:hypothetical protein